MDVSEITLAVKASQQGNRDAFGQLVHAFQRPAMTMAIRLLWDEELAEEVVQISFVKAWQRIGQLRQPKRFPGWFFRVVSHTALNQMRRHQRKSKLQQAAMQVKPRPEAHVLDHAQELNQHLQAALTKLGEKEALAVSLTGLEELSYEQAAQIMRCSTGSLRQHLFRARQKLKIMLKDYLE